MTINKFTRNLPFLVFACFLTLAFQTNFTSQIQKEKREESWKQNLYEENVQYENFACNKEDAEIVKDFFVKRPLKPILPICHNNCPIIKCRPVVPFPAIAKSIRAVGKVSVHILVDESGKVLYARVLSGHPLLQAAARKGACETQFEKYSYGKHQGVMHFTVDGYDFLGVPNRANEVW